MPTRHSMHRPLRLLVIAAAAYAVAGAGHASGSAPGSVAPVAAVARAPEPAPARIERRVPLMGTVAALVVEAPDRAAALAASEAALRALEETEQRLSTWREDSELARLNQAPVSRPVPLSPLLAAELAAARRCWQATEGAFDPGIGALVDAWGLRRGGREPAAAELREALAPGGLAALELTAATAIRRHPGLRLEEGGFGKGAGLDRALAALAAGPPVSAVLDLGGQLAVSGGAATSLAIADPRQRSRPVLELTLTAGSVATSGNSERGIEVDGHRRAHLLDPARGVPVRDFGSLTISAPTALEADCLATGLYVQGPRRALAWAAAHEGIEAVVVEPHGDGLRATATAGLLLRPLVDGIELDRWGEAG